MKRSASLSSWPVSFALALAAGSLLSSCTATADTGADESAVRTLMQEMEAANNMGDVDGWVGLFATDFVYMAPGAPAVTSRDELLELARTGFRNHASIRIDPVEVRVTGDWAFSRNDVTGTVELYGSGENVDIAVKEIAILHRDESGTWEVARLIMNSDS